MKPFFKKIELGIVPMVIIMLMIVLGFVALPMYIYPFAVATSAGLVLWYLLRYVLAAGRASEMFVHARSLSLCLPRWALAVLLVLTLPFVGWAIGWTARFVNIASRLIGIAATFAVPATLVILALVFIFTFVKNRRGK